MATSDNLKMDKSVKKWINKTASTILQISPVGFQNTFLISLQVQNLPRGDPLDPPMEEGNLPYLPHTHGYVPFTSILLP